MKMQTFYAPNITQALEKVQKELGPDAFVISVRQVNSKFPWHIGKRPEVEVIAMASNPTREGIGSEKERLNVFNNQETGDSFPHGRDRIKTSSNSAIQKALSNISIPLRNYETTQDKNKKVVDENIEGNIPSKELLLIQRRLSNQGVDEQIIHRLLSSCVNSPNPRIYQDIDILERHIQHQLNAHLRFISLNGNKPSSRWIFFVGMSGSGKTSCIAKIAMHFIQSQHKKIHWVCANTVRASAISEARIYAESLGIPLHFAYTPEDLLLIATTTTSADFILVDTYGCNPHNMYSVLELGGFLSKIQERMVVLTAAATSKHPDLKQILTSLAPFGLDALIITKMDETSTIGDVLNFAWSSHLPIAYFTTGPEIIGDLQPASAEFLTKKLLREP